MNKIHVDTELSQQIIELPPEKIKLNPNYNVRPFSLALSTKEDEEEEDERVERLALMIEKVGQLNPVLITADYELIAGNRRRRAIIILNERRSSCFKSLLKVKCLIKTDGDLWQAAIIDNLHRQDYSPMEITYLIARTRERYGWKNTKEATKKVADLMGVSFSYVVQHERLLGFDRETQRKLHNKVLTMQSGLDLLKIPADKRAKAIQRATILQQEERLEKTLHDLDSNKKTQDEATAAIYKRIPRIEHPHVIRAIREQDPKKKIAHRLTDTLKILRRFSNFRDCPADQQEFIHYLTEIWVPGKGTDAELEARFRRLCNPMELPFPTKRKSLVC